MYENKLFATCAYATSPAVAEAVDALSSLVTPMADTQNAMPAYQLNGMRYTGGKGLVVTKGKSLCVDTNRLPFQVRKVGPLPEGGFQSR